MEVPALYYSLTRKVQVSIYNKLWDELLTFFLLIAVVLKALTSILVIKIKSFLEENPSIGLLCGVNQNNLGMARINHYFRYELRNYNSVLLIQSCHNGRAS